MQEELEKLLACDIAAVNAEIERLEQECDEITKALFAGTPKSYNEEMRRVDRQHMIVSEYRRRVSALYRELFNLKNTTVKNGFFWVTAVPSKTDVSCAA